MHPDGGVAARFSQTVTLVAGQPLAVLDIQKIIAHLRDRGIGILITDHNVTDLVTLQAYGGGDTVRGRFLWKRSATARNNESAS